MLEFVPVHTQIQHAVQVPTQCQTCPAGVAAVLGRSDAAQTSELQALGCIPVETSFTYGLPYRQPSILPSGI